MKTYTYDETLAMLTGIVSENGEDFVYEVHDEDRLAPSCRYALDGQPDCIVGHVFAKVGVPVEKMEYVRSDGWESGAAGPVNPYSVEGADLVAGRLEGDGVVAFTPKAKRLLISVQVKQDAGDSWGEALSEGVLRAKDLPEDQFYF